MYTSKNFSLPRFHHMRFRLPAGFVFLLVEKAHKSELQHCNVLEVDT